MLKERQERDATFNLQYLKFTVTEGTGAEGRQEQRTSYPGRNASPEKPCPRWRIGPTGRGRQLALRPEGADRVLPPSPSGTLDPWFRPTYGGTSRSRRCQTEVAGFWATGASWGLRVPRSALTRAQPNPRRARAASRAGDLSLYRGLQTAGQATNPPRIGG